MGGEKHPQKTLHPVARVHTYTSYVHSGTQDIQGINAFWK